MSKTGKSRKKYDGASSLAVNELAGKYGVTTAFVYAALRGDRDSEKANQIKREYGSLYDSIQDILKNKGNTNN